ncbi:MAG TPA: Fe-S-containing hydro-lyase [Syntrophorhabdus sp.]|jgi:fumarate hydratase subunit beta|nr:Fe-S-containing hydro-lyase [Syntrophorhabdus sp.]MDI9559334.1 Fe-S-containing hydro-lyase [Pseudomonadota bacterium]OPX95913.1 MAG: Fumarate hydratase class I, aerobic [Syntrophorhabdus sp. PtaB.Bin027]OQB74052.1 MAG: Fumarate hydratase class I, aerobic [Deltaproteobacteria bacterium ADurb.Bin135]MBP8744722.1 Fe-S-containing hydro-lyase [Syntrophorhabdus sp.]
MEIKRIKTPLEPYVIEQLKAGEKVFLSGYIYTSRDAAHKRFVDTLNEGGRLPFDIQNQVIYYCGPSPAPPGRVIGACGPTTSSRMDAYAPRLVSLGLKGMIGKGKRSQAVKDALKQYKAVYFGATGGAGALLSKSVISSEVVAYEELGPEAVVKLGVVDMPLFVINDVYGNDLYESGAERYKR